LRSVFADRQHGLTSGVFLRSREEVEMPQLSVLSESTAASREAEQVPFICTWKAAGRNAAWVLLTGGLDPASSPQLRRTLRDAQLHARVVVLDLRRLTFIDTSCVDVVLNAACVGRREGGRVMLIRGPVRVDRVFTLTAASDEVLIVDLDPSQPPIEVADLDRHRRTRECHPGGRPDARRSARR
jgi:anti-anti-sigma factor